MWNRVHGKKTVVTEKGVYNFSVFKVIPITFVTLVQAFFSEQQKNKTAFSLKLNVKNIR